MKGFLGLFFVFFFLSQSTEANVIEKSLRQFFSTPNSSIGTAGTSRLSSSGGSGTGFAGTGSSYTKEEEALFRACENYCFDHCRAGNGSGPWADIGHPECQEPMQNSPPFEYICGCRSYYRPPANGKKLHK